jgi:hypothetical protein
VVTALILALITAEINECEQQANCPGHGNEEEAAYFQYVAATNGLMCPWGRPTHRDKCVVAPIRHMPDEMAIEYGGEPE